jgi:hypothetical protein
MIRVSSLCLMSLGVGLLSATSAEGLSAQAPFKVSDHAQLFLDDHVVAKSTNLKREVQRPVKHPENPLIVQDLPWEKRLIATYGTVFFDGQAGKFRCWYTAGENKDGLPDTPDGPVTAEYFICYAESEDGIHWKKPMVGPAKFGLHDRHNIVVPTGHGFCVLLSQDKHDLQKRYLGAGGAIFGYSPDGIHWKTHDWRAAVGKNDTSSCVVRWNDEYLAYVRFQVEDPAWPGVMRGIGLCTSHDFTTWTPKQLVIKTDEKDGYPWTQPYAIAVTPYGEQLIGILSVLHLDRVAGNNSLGDEDTQLMVSRDGRHWNRVADRGTFLAPSPKTWDCGRIHAPTTSMFVKDDVVYVYYSASEVRHGTEGWGVPGIGLATMPAERFVAVGQQNANAPGELQTRPLEFSGKSLLVNTDCKTEDLQVELLDPAGKVLAGFDRSCSQLIAHDKLRRRIVWVADGTQKTLKDASELQPLAIRFVLRNGPLFSFQIAVNVDGTTRISEFER